MHRPLTTGLRTVVVVGPDHGREPGGMFDRSTVVLMHYEQDGRQISRELYEGDPAPFIEYQRIAVEASVPFLEHVRA
ncbi:hypothetical protein ACFWBI_13245 [Streptomyces sp. NPDC059982]|uniref:hypothetical protein n=1 Tax=unclassified Streptomyces TaxID=2593676 RepID=UPI0036BB9C34